MSVDTHATPNDDLAPLWSVAAEPRPAAALRALVSERLAALRLRPYASNDPDAGTNAGAGGGPKGGPEGGNLAVTLSGRSAARRPLVLTTRIDRTDPPGLAAVAAVLAVAGAVAPGDLERDVILVLADDAPVGEAAGARGAPTRPIRHGSTRWFERERRHDVKAAIVIEAIRPARLEALQREVLRVSGVETEARMLGVLEGAAPPECRLLLTRHLDDGLPFAAHAVPYLTIGGAVADGESPGAATTRGPATAGDARSSAAGGGSAPSRALLEHLARLAAALTATLLIRLDAARLPSPYDEHDSTEAEHASLIEAAGPHLAALGGPPRDRHDLQRILARLH